MKDKRPSLERKPSLVNCIGSVQRVWGRAEERGRKRKGKGKGREGGKVKGT